MNRWLDMAGYQAVWFAAVIGAGRGTPLPGVVAAAAFAAWHLHGSHDAARTLRLIAAGLLAGLLLDGGLVRAGLLHFAAGWSDGVRWIGAPAWILALWMAFALTLGVSLAPLQRRPLLAALLGGLGAPLAYLGAARGWNAVRFDAPAWHGLLGLALGWSIALPTLATLARPRPSGTPAAHIGAAS